MNLFTNLSSCSSKKEHFQTLLRLKNIKIERIVSHGQKTPPGKWLKQGKAEWVVVLKGRAKILFKGSRSRKPVSLKAGDSLFIPAKTPHRVEWTQPRRPTVWLAVHF